MRCHEVDYTILGDDLQMVEVELDAGESVIAEAGAMNYLQDGIEFEARLGDGSRDEGLLGSLLSAGKRAVTGESLFMTHFTNHAAGKRRAAFAAPYPGKIIAANLAELGEELICQKDAFLHAGGTVVQRELTGETLRVDTGCLVGFTPGIDYSIEMAGGLRSMFFAGEGFFLTTLSGRGTVWLQSLPFSRLADRILEHAPKVGGRERGEGSLLGRLARLFER